MSPEETLRRYLDVQDSGSLYHYWSTGDMADEIASIIRKAQASARNEALEEAAVVLDEGPLDPSAFERGQTLPATFSDIAERIRNLKTKD